MEVQCYMALENSELQILLMPATVIVITVVKTVSSCTVSVNMD